MNHLRIVSRRDDLTASRLIAEVAERHGLTVADLVGPSRKAYIVCARAEAAYRILRSTDLTLREIGLRLGGRDHSTISALVSGYEFREWVAS